MAGQIIGPSKINDEIALLPELSSNTAVASSKDLKTDDRRHIDASSMKKLGRLYAIAMEALVE